jgi:hypothetical protein
MAIGVIDGVQIVLGFVLGYVFFVVFVPFNHFFRCCWTQRLPGGGIGVGAGGCERAQSS